MDKTAKERMKRYRNKKRNGAKISLTGEEESVTISVTGEEKYIPICVTAQHPVMKYLIPGKDRDKMEVIVTELKKHKQLDNVYLGCGSYSLPLDIVGEMLECTR